LGVNFFKIFLTYNFFHNDKNYDQSNFDLSEGDLSDPELEKPQYSALLPVLREERVVIEQLISSIKSMNYPTYMIEVFFLVESDDYICSSILESIQLDYTFSLLKIPKIKPYTKAKACNFALNFCSGEILTIFDADDVPQPNQFLIVLNKFHENKDISSIQCILNSYNCNSNLLTKFFSVEYSIWFKCLLKSLNSLKMPITLGGTSNYFKSSIIKKISWDSYNVTEDAELGVLFWLQNQKIIICDSKTLEEAPLSISAWIKQRSRWIKGFLQTYFSYISRKNFLHLNFINKIKFLIWMNFFMFLPIFSQFIIFFIPLKFIVLNFSSHDFIKNFLWWLYFLNFIIYYFGQIYILLMNSKNFIVKLRFIDYFIFPFYCFLNIFATYKGVWQFFTKPYFWEKTMHGIWHKKIKK
jgi:cellulose synthase/poly-beta-1,6-N-acetylglucosamine synthase-like glycosyltransferase